MASLGSEGVAGSTARFYWRFLAESNNEKL